MSEPDWKKRIRADAYLGPRWTESWLRSRDESGAPLDMSERNACIVSDRDHGMKAKDIAAKYGLTVQRVMFICQRADKRAREAMCPP